MGAVIRKIPPGNLRGTAILIFATVGSCKTSFDRLVKAVDKLALKISEEVIIQKGVSKYQSQTANCFEFCDQKRMAALISKANIVISHAGFGIIAESIQMNKRLILIPREHRFGDAEGNQVELAEYLAEKTGGITCVRNVNLLQTAVEHIREINPSYQFTNKIPGK